MESKGMSVSTKYTYVRNYILAFLCCFSTIFLTYTNNTLYKVFILIFCIAAIFKCFQQKVISKEKLIFFKDWLFFLIWCALSSIWAYEKVEIDMLIVLFLIGLTCLSISFFITVQEQVYIFFNMIIISAIVLEVYIFHYYGRSMLITRFDNEVVNSNRVGTILALAAFLCVFLHEIKRQKVYLAIAVFLSVGVLLSGSRSALLSFIIMTGTFFLLKDRSKFIITLRNIIFIAVILLIIFFCLIKIEGLYNIIGKRCLALLDLIIEEKKTGKSTNIRSYLIQYGIELFKEKPFIGWGIDNYRYMNKYNTYAHSNLVELLVDVGIIGCILFYRIYYIIINKIRIIIKSNERDTAFLIAYLLGMLLINFTGVYYNDMIDIIMACLMYVYVSKLGVSEDVSSHIL